MAWGTFRLGAAGLGLEFRAGGNSLTPDLLGDLFTPPEFNNLIVVQYASIHFAYANPLRLKRKPNPRVFTEAEESFTVKIFVFLISHEMDVRKQDTRCQRQLKLGALPGS